MQPVKTKKKLSRADKKQIEAAIARANRTDKKGKSAHYGEDGLEAIPVKEMEQGNFREKNDYVYYLSFRFEK